MNLIQEKALFHLTGKLDFSLLTVETFQDLANEHPYFAPTQFFLNSFLTHSGTTLSIPQSIKTNFYFTNPYWLQFLLQHGLKNKPENIHSPKSLHNLQTSDFDTPVVEGVNETIQNVDPFIPKTQNIVEMAENDIENGPNAKDPLSSENKISGLLSGQLAEFKKPIDANAKLDIDALTERMHTIDYFASQGIKLDLASIPQDKLTVHLRKFTDWLKQMKQVENGSLVLGTTPEMENKVAETAQNSNETREILTNTMADVLVKQGQVDKAIQLYIKLSFLNPEKSSYFAAKIEQLKGI